MAVPHISCAQPSAAPPAADAEIAEGCLVELEQGGVRLQPPKPSQNIELPVQVDRQLGSLVLVPRGPYPALMDCSLALALQKAAPVFVGLGVNELHFSAAYDHRMRRGTSQLSSHSFGRAIDVHVLSGPAGLHDITKDFERGVGAWLGITPRPGALEECIGNPATDKGRTLRTLVCRLKLQTELRIIVTPDDNDDHRDHIHLEYALPYKPRVAEAIAVAPAPAVKKKQDSITISKRAAVKKPAAKRTAVKRPAVKNTLAKKTVKKPLAKKTAIRKPTRQTAPKKPSRAGLKIVPPAR